jgi:hypothetical protein
MHEVRLWHVPAVALRTVSIDLDQLFAEAGQRPWFCRLGHCQRPHEIAEVVGERMKLEADGIGDEGAARQSRPFDRALAFFDPLLRRAALVVEGNDALRRPRQIGHDKADPRIKFTRMPLDLRHDTPRLLSTLRLIPVAGVVAAHVMRSPDRALQQVTDLVLQDPVGGQPDCSAGRPSPDEDSVVMAYNF